MVSVVRDCVPIGKKYLFDTFRELKSLRRQADYSPTNITMSDLEPDLLREAKELFGLVEKKLAAE